MAVLNKRKPHAITSAIWQSGTSSSLSCSPVHCIRAYDISDDGKNLDLCPKIEKRIDSRQFCLDIASGSGFRLNCNYWERNQFLCQEHLFLLLLSLLDARRCCDCITGTSKKLTQRLPPSNIGWILRRLWVIVWLHNRRLNICKYSCFKAYFMDVLLNDLR